VQAVYDLYDIVPGPQWPTTTAAGSSAPPAGGGAGEAGAGEARRVSRVVVIGRHLDRALLQAGLEAAAA
jgi:hypothetical protein